MDSMYLDSPYSNEDIVDSDEIKFTDYFTKNLKHFADSFNKNYNDLCVTNFDKEPEFKKEFNTVIDESSIKCKRKSKKNFYNSISAPNKVRELRFIDSFYKSIREYHGFISRIDYENEFIFATMHNLKNESDILKAQIEFDDIENYESEKHLIQIGAPFIWIFGREVISGREQKVSYIRFRRMPTWTKSRIQDIEAEAEETADALSKLFSKS
ncbi:hypothetical protein CI105_04645 [Candidatus Izimaplasma bacterium ZiA1]|uniref:hypothetical protein n=1 Tax=Candidatus Izimoplasma sp. ZiA1 TaxID=2024899 RepID=UPI000BAA8AEE|nr:hypothetical protein CI105_04645 [Candidatus Izimaplasma bacterium ZiA1]